MATSRIGGTSGKLSGQVGNIVFQVVKNANGSYTQIQYEKGQRTETTITPKLQAQRMATAMVESMMRDLKPVAKISMQAAKNKTLSVNSFSSFNLLYLLRDMKENWYGQNLYVYPRHKRTDINIQDLGGVYLISSGTLSYNIYDELSYIVTPAAEYNGVPSIGMQFNGIKFSCRIGIDTVGDFLKQHRATKLDQFVWCGFDDWIEYDTEGEDPVEYMKHFYFIASFALLIPSDTIMTPEVIRSLLVISANFDVDVLFAKDGQSFIVGKLTEFELMDENIWYHAGFSISKYTGKKLISSSRYATPDGSNDPWWINQAPCHVFGTWMGEPSVDPYPNPFA